MPSAIESRIRFHPDIQVMEFDFTSMIVVDAETVHQVYDAIERRLAPTNRKWFFLVNYEHCDIAPEAWSAFASRGKSLNIAYSLGTVRFGAPEKTRAEIDTAAAVEEFDANQVTTRDQALARIGWLSRDREAQGLTDVTPDYPPARNATYADRVSFDHDMGVMEVDFSDFTFATSGAVNGFYDEIERLCAQTQRKWYFLVNYCKLRIYPEAWIAFAHRGKRLNLGYSLGSVRYDVSEANRTEIQRRAETESFQPNLYASRDAALRRIQEMRVEVGVA